MDLAPSDDLRLHIVRDAVRRRWPALVVVVLVVLLPVALFTAMRPTRHVASSATLLRPIPGNALSETATASSQQITIAMETEAELVTSPAVVDKVNDDLGWSLKPGTRAVRVSIPPNTEIIRIEYTTRSAEDAQTGAQAFAEAFLAYRSDQAEATQKRQLDSLNHQLDVAQSAFRAAAKDASGVTPSASAEARMQLYAGRVASLQEAIGTLQATDTDPGSIVTPASPQASPAGVSPIILLGGAGVFALALGLVLIVWLERRDDRIRGVETTEIGGLPVYPLALADRQTGPTLVIDRELGDPVSDAYRRVRTAVTVGVPRPGIVVFSALQDGFDIGAVVVNVALSLTRAGFRVTVVDAGIGASSVAELLDLDPAPGVSDAIDRRLRDGAALHLGEKHGLMVLPAGTDPAAHREEYGSPALAKVLARLRRRSDYVLVAGPASSVAEGIAVAQAGDGLILVAREKQDTFAEVARDITRAQRADVSVLATLVADEGKGQRRWRTQPPEKKTKKQQQSAKKETEQETDTSSEKESQKPAGKIMGKASRSDDRHDDTPDKGADGKADEWREEEHDRSPGRGSDPDDPGQDRESGDDDGEAVLTGRPSSSQSDGRGRSSTTAGKSAES